MGFAYLLDILLHILCIFVNIAFFLLLFGKMDNLQIILSWNPSSSGEQISIFWKEEDVEVGGYNFNGFCSFVVSHSQHILYLVMPSQAIFLAQLMLAILVISSGQTLLWGARSQCPFLLWRTMCFHQQKYARQSRPCIEKWHSGEQLGSTLENVLENRFYQLWKYSLCKQNISVHVLMICWIPASQAHIHGKIVCSNIFTKAGTTRIWANQAYNSKHQIIIGRCALCYTPEQKKKNSIIQFVVCFFCIFWKNTCGPDSLSWKLSPFSNNLCCF